MAEVYPLTLQWVGGLNFNIGTILKEYYCSDSSAPDKKGNRDNLGIVSHISP